MNLSFSKVEVEMLKVLQQKDQRYRKGLEYKIKEEVKFDYEKLKR